MLICAREAALECEHSIIRTPLQAWREDLQRTNLYRSGGKVDMLESCANMADGVEKKFKSEADRYLAFWNLPQP